ncbi:MAG: hypothetical protein IKE95_08685 [Methanobrevibacter sp.]|nr:hypothetical protein [Methanobrevibacter sp.]
MCWLTRCIFLPACIERCIDSLGAVGYSITQCPNCTILCEYGAELLKGV